jgi:hypothetical protein
MPRIGRIGLAIGLALATAFAGCDGNQAPVVPTTKAEPEVKAAPAPAPPARGKATPKTLPRSEGKR